MKKKKLYYSKNFIQNVIDNKKNIIFVYQTLVLFENKNTIDDDQLYISVDVETKIYLLPSAKLYIYGSSLAIDSISNIEIDTDSSNNLNTSLYLISSQMEVNNIISTYIELINNSNIIIKKTINSSNIVQNPTFNIDQYFDIFLEDIIFNILQNKLKKKKDEPLVQLKNTTITNSHIIFNKIKTSLLSTSGKVTFINSTILFDQDINDVNNVINSKGEIQLNDSKIIFNSKIEYSSQKNTSNKVCNFEILSLTNDSSIIFTKNCINSVCLYITDKININNSTCAFFELIDSTSTGISVKENTKNHEIKNVSFYFFYDLESGQLINIPKNKNNTFDLNMCYLSNSENIIFSANNFLSNNNSFLEKLMIIIVNEPCQNKHDSPSEEINMNKSQITNENNSENNHENANENYNIEEIINFLNNNPNFINFPLVQLFINIISQYKKNCIPKEDIYKILNLDYQGYTNQNCYPNINRDCYSINNENFIDGNNKNSINCCYDYHQSNPINTFCEPYLKCPLNNNLINSFSNIKNN